MMKGMALAVLLWLVLVSCGGAAQGPDATPSVTPTPESSLQTEPEGAPSVTSPEGPEPTPPPPSASPGTPPSTGEAEIPEGLESVVSEVVADLASRLGVSASQIVVVSAEEVTWRDGSLGCPEPGMAYTQALVNGTRIRLSSGGVLYEYH